MKTRRFGCFRKLHYYIYFKCPGENRPSPNRANEGRPRNRVPNFGTKGDGTRKRKLSTQFLWNVIKKSSSIPTSASGRSTKPYRAMWSQELLSSVGPITENSSSGSKQSKGLLMMEDQNYHQRCSAGSSRNSSERSKRTVPSKRTMPKILNYLSPWDLIVKNNLRCKNPNCPIRTIQQWKSSTRGSRRVPQCSPRKCKKDWKSSPSGMCRITP